MDGHNRNKTMSTVTIELKTALLLAVQANGLGAYVLAVTENSITFYARSITMLTALNIIDDLMRLFGGKYAVSVNANETLTITKK